MGEEAKVKAEAKAVVDAEAQLKDEEETRVKSEDDTTAGKSPAEQAAELLRPVEKEATESVKAFKLEIKTPAEPVNQVVDEAASVESDPVQVEGASNAARKLEPKGQ